MKPRSLLPVLLLVGALGALIGASYLIKHQTTPEAPDMKVATLQPGRVATLRTNRGVIRFVIYERDTPITSRNFIDLARKGFYRKLKFHRVEKWVIQTGDPTGTGKGGSGKSVPLEVIPGLDFAKPYIAGMARGKDPNSATSQFFITRKAAPELSGQYAAFGRVFEGQDVVNRMKRGDSVEDVTISKPSRSDLSKIGKLDW